MNIKQVNNKMQRRTPFFVVIRKTIILLANSNDNNKYNIRNKTNNFLFCVMMKSM